MSIPRVDHETWQALSQPVPTMGAKPAPVRAVQPVAEDCSLAPALSAPRRALDPRGNPPDPAAVAIPRVCAPAAHSRSRTPERPRRLA
eukprot:CAMPEP_0170421494 /NCGR_PEP_ID=MMETSP0117_2-20130122/35930_1 /TAXON_ID=400756 /ORGANISM="Durinskia baltica, Strain CSIRO CS-38" /LENGTH=87 /DNA_ID=CAMNT_0010680051 /DNA_START=14 /DNA_END=275 /DNA_ORIENTATION=-